MRFTSSLLICVVFVVYMTLSAGQVASTQFNYEGRRARTSREQTQDDETTITDAMDFMKKFGYLPRSSNTGLVSELMSSEEVSKAIKMVQKIGKLPETGVLDEATARYIKQPRCGNTDANLVAAMQDSDNSETSRQKRYTINERNLHWKKQVVTWRLNRCTPKVPRQRVMEELRRAFDLWSEASNLRFQLVDEYSRAQEADIVVSFESGSHGDPYVFDGPGAVLAHAFMPSGSELGGDLHMDEAENWKTHEESKRDPHSTTSLLWVATHELGHSLGLEHSADEHAVMFPHYSATTVQLDGQLPPDDTMAIKTLYREFAGQNPQFHVDGPIYEPGPKVIPRLYPPRVPTTTTATRRPIRYTPPRRPPPPTSTARPTRPQTSRTVRTTTTSTELPTLDICTLIPDVMTTIRRELYVFKDKQMWRILSNGKMLGPYLIHMFWIGLPKDVERVDAVYEKQTGDYGITIFSGNRFWVFNDRNLIYGYPKHIGHLGLPRDVERLDAALPGGQEGKTHFFSGNRYWAYDERRQRVENDYPQTIDSWKGVQLPISSAMRWKDGVAYFFRGRLFWAFNDTQMEVQHPVGSITASYWFGCPVTEGSYVEDNSIHNQPEERRRSEDMSETSEAFLINPHKFITILTLIVILTSPIITCPF